MKFVFDASAAIAILKGEEGSNVILKLLSNSRSQFRIHAINLCEVYYGFLQSSGKEYANRALAILLTAGISVAEIMDPIVWKTSGKLKTEYRLSLADAFDVAYAIRNDATFVTADHRQLDQLANDNVCKFFFFR